MSALSNKISELETRIDALLSSIEYSSIGATEIKQLVGVSYRMKLARDKIEQTLGYDHKELTAQIVDMPVNQVAALTPKRDRVPRKIPAALSQFVPTIDTLMSEESICAQVKITTPTLTRWRRNWYGIAGIGFPPPVIYVYGSPRWTARQLDWWMNDSKEKVFIKESNDESSR